MKFLLVFVVVLIGFFAWRSGRRASAQSSVKTERPSAPKPIQDMVACGHCGVHLPRSEALHGRRGPYCGAPHLEQAGDTRA